MIEHFLEGSPQLGMDTFFILLILVALEAVLSADNAIALASISRGLPDAKLQRQALNYGLLIAYILRISLILMATWVIGYWQFELAGALYLLWLVFQYFTSGEGEGEDHHHGLHFTSLWQAIPMIAFTDLAFSLDSVTTAIAVAPDRIGLIIAGGTIGVITLRFLAGLFIRWIKEYEHLEDAGYITVGLVGLRLLLKVIDSTIVPPQWLMITAILSIFAWGFSKRNPVAIVVDNSDTQTDTHPVRDEDKVIPS
jgi:YkoY family integral membrane protein